MTTAPIPRTLKARRWRDDLRACSGYWTKTIASSAPRSRPALHRRWWRHNIRAACRQRAGAFARPRSRARSAPHARQRRRRRNYAGTTAGQ
jgi:hypothetical protein